jgi:apolipoprotein N-acyltransferase
VLLPYAFALTSGACLVLSFPRFGHPAFGWIALVPLLVALSGWRGAIEPLRGQPALRAFTCGLLAGWIYFLGTVYWTADVVRTFGGLPAPVALFAMAMLALYLALYPAVSALITARMVRATGLRGLLCFPAAWVATEYWRGTYIMGGFPWVPLGNSQVEMLPVAQLASVFGVYGVSALVALVNVLVACALVSTGRTRTAVLAGAVALPLACAAWGAWRIADGSLMRKGDALTVGLVQANIDQATKWSGRFARKIFTTHIAITRDVARRGATLVVWPESSLPFRYNDDATGRAELQRVVRELGVHLLFGSDELVDGRTSYNSAFLMAPSGETLAVYRKIHLVPFGEFIPYGGWLAFFPPLVETLGGFAPFAPGTSVVMLPLGKHQASTAICYEVTYPELIATAVRQGSRLLTTITNDGWYGTSSAPYQHFEMARMRAIEQGRYLVRAANTGISGIVDPYGRLVARSAIFTEAGIVGEVRLLEDRTIYSRIGDVVPYAAIAGSLLALLASMRVKNKS